MSVYVFPPPAVFSLPIKGISARFPVQRLYFVGRNYHAHAQEMGKPVDKATELNLVLEGLDADLH